MDNNYIRSSLAARVGFDITDHHVMSYFQLEPLFLKQLKAFVIRTGLYDDVPEVSLVWYMNNLKNLNKEFVPDAPLEYYFRLNYIKVNDSTLLKDMQIYYDWLSGAH